MEPRLTLVRIRRVVGIAAVSEAERDETATGPSAVGGKSHTRDVRLPTRFAKDSGIRTRVVPIAAVAAVAALGIVAAPAGSRSTGDRDLPGDSSVPFWPHETAVDVGTSETFVDVRDDGSYFDPSIGRRVFRVN